MGIRQKLVWAVVTAFFTLGMVHSPVFAQSSVSVGVGDTVVDVSGYGPPNSLVEIKENGVTLSSVASDTSGYFSALLNAQQSGLRNISFIASTLSFTQTDEITLNVNLVAHGTTVITAFLPPTLHLNSTSLNQGQTLVLNGLTRPGSKVIANVDGGAVIKQTTANSSGVWQLNVPTNSLGAGTHSVFVVALFGINSYSYPTEARNFYVNAPGAPTGGVPGTTDQDGETPDIIIHNPDDEKGEEDPAVPAFIPRALLISSGLGLHSLTVPLLFAALAFIARLNLWFMIALLLLLLSLYAFYMFYWLPRRKQEEKNH